MVQKIFVNLPVADLERSKSFYGALGFTNEAGFTDETAAAMKLDDRFFVMLLTHEKWRSFTAKDIPDARTNAQVMIALSLADRAAVDSLVSAAVAKGGTADPTPRQDHGFMYGRSFEDPDGHIWEPHWMDPNAMAAGATAETAA